MEFLTVLYSFVTTVFIFIFLTCKFQLYKCAPCKVGDEPHAILIMHKKKKHHYKKPETLDLGEDCYNICVALLHESNYKNTNGDDEGSSNLFIIV